MIKKIKYIYLKIKTIPFQYKIYLFFFFGIVLPYSINTYLFIQNQQEIAFKKIHDLYKIKIKLFSVELENNIKDLFELNNKNELLEKYLVVSHLGDLPLTKDLFRAIKKKFHESEKKQGLFFYNENINNLKLVYVYIDNQQYIYYKFNGNILKSKIFSEEKIKKNDKFFLFNTNHTAILSNDFENNFIVKKDWSKIIKNNLLKKSLNTLDIIHPPQKRKYLFLQHKMPNLPLIGIWLVPYAKIVSPINQLLVKEIIIITILLLLIIIIAKIIARENLKTFKLLDEFRERIQSHDYSLKRNFQFYDNRRKITKTLNNITNILKRYHELNVEKIITNEKLLQDKNQLLENTIQELKKVQDQIIEQEKMASIGQLTAGIAHELNNPMNFIYSNIEPLEDRIKDLTKILNLYQSVNKSSNVLEQLDLIKQEENELDIEESIEDVQIILETMQEGIERSTEIIRNLQAYTRDRKERIEILDINKTIEIALSLLRPKYKDKIKITKKFNSNIFCEGRGVPIGQVVMNIVDNAIYALKNIKEPEIIISTSTSGKNSIIQISDNGTGIPDEVVQKIFDPFFTTKKIGEGTGLGLSIVYKIIKLHNGNIDIKTKKNQGSTFIITLPIKMTNEEN